MSKFLGPIEHPNWRLITKMRRPLAKALIAANVDQIIWGTDWPHTNSSSGNKATEVTPLFQIDDGRLTNQLVVWAPDPATRKKILVDNPARLRNAATCWVRSLGEPPSRKPTTGIAAACCACVASGIEAAEPARSVMNSRRLIDVPRDLGQGIEPAQTSTPEGTGREGSDVRFGSKADIVASARQCRRPAGAVSMRLTLP